MKKFSKTTLSKLMPPLCGLAGLYVVWKLIAIAVNASNILPSPEATFASAYKLILTGYWRDLLATAERTFASWSLALIIGIPFGLVLGLFRRAHDAVSPLLSFLRSLPAFMLITIPVAIGQGGEIARIGTVTFACALIVVDACAESLVTLPIERLDVLRAYRAGTWFLLTRVMFFEALGRAIVPSARTIVGIAFISAIVCESLVTPAQGVGARLLTSLASLDMPSVYAFLLLTGLTGLALNVIVQSLARKIIFWT